jgi:hypothetical protein
MFQRSKEQAAGRAVPSLSKENIPGELELSEWVLGIS